MSKFNMRSNRPSPVRSRWVPIADHPDYSALSETFMALSEKYTDTDVVFEKLKSRIKYTVDSDGAPVVLAKL